MNSFDLISWPGFEPNKQIPIDALLTGAPVLKEYADACAAKDPNYAQSGAWYHRAWLYLRVANCVAAPKWHTDFYEQSFQQAFDVARANPKILISGTADYSLPAVLFDSLKTSVAQAEVTVTDLAEPPLKICDWWANQTNSRIKLIQQDILKPVPSFGDFDIITADAFLTRFNSNQAAQVLNHWHGWLAPNGKIITTVRIDGSTKSITTDRDKMAFIFRARNFYSSVIKDKKLSEEVTDMADEYVARMKSSNLGDKDSVINLFRRSGFSIQSSQVVSTMGEFTPTKYLRIVASREP